MLRRSLALLALVMLGGTASAGTLKLGKSFTPNPTITEEVMVNVESGVYAYDLGFKKCDPGGGGNTTKNPAFTFELTDKLPELSVRVENRSGGNAGVGAVIQFPDGTYLCEGDKDDFFFKDWPKGTYKMWFYGPSISVGGILRFEMPSRSKDAVAAAQKKLPTVKLGTEGANGGANPAFLPLAATASAEAQDLNLTGCADARTRIMPLATLEIAKQSTYYLDIPDVDLFVVTPDNKCGSPQGDGLQLDAGTHTLWAKVPDQGLPEDLQLEADDRSRALAFGDATRQDAGSLDEPLVLDGTVRAAESWPSRRGACGGAARAPDFYITSDNPLQNVELSLLWSKKGQRLHVYGPLKKMTAGWSVDCGEVNQQPRKYELFEGTYAVWVGSEKGSEAKGDAFHILLRRSDVALDPLKTLTEIPAELDMSERPYANHYPFFTGRTEADWTAIFTTAPDRLFVYARVDTGDDYGKVKAGEPLLLDWYNDDYSAVRRYDGSSLRVRTELLSTDAPSTITLPTKATPRQIDDVGTAMQEAGPEDDKAIKAYLKLDDKYQDCIYKYLSKHDPTWGTGDTVYKISGSGRVTNVSEEVGRAGDKKCGYSKVDKAATGLVKKLAKTRAARAAKRLAAVRARFGLSAK
jgi:hypothetical protein